MDYRVLGNPAAEASKALQECGGAPVCFSPGLLHLSRWQSIQIMACVDCSCHGELETLQKEFRDSDWGCFSQPQCPAAMLGEGTPCQAHPEWPRDEQVPVSWVQEASPLGHRGTDTSAQEGLVLAMFCLYFVEWSSMWVHPPNTTVGVWTLLRPLRGQELHNLNPVFSGHSRTHCWVLSLGTRSTYLKKER